MGRAVEILSIRHGRTPHNASGRFVGITDSPLDAVGRAQATALHDRLRAREVDAVVASPLARAWATARRPGVPVRLVPGLMEMDQGVFEGRPLRDVLSEHAGFFARWRQDPTGLVVPGGESLDGVRDRGLAALEAVARRAVPGSRVLAVSHQLVLSSVACTLDGQPLARWSAYRCDHAGGWRLWFDGSRLRLGGRIAGPVV